MTKNGVIIVAEKIMVHNKSTDMINWNAAEDIKIYKEVLVSLDVLRTFHH